MYIDLPVGIVFFIIGAFLGVFFVYWASLTLLKKYSPALNRKLRKNHAMIVLAFLLVLLVILTLLPVVLIKINSGHAGVLWQRFNGGTKLGPPFPEGVVLVAPWDHLTVYSLRFQTKKVPVYAVTSEGLKITLNIVVRYRPVRENLTALHKEIGQDYVERLLLPEVASSARMVVSEYRAEQVYFSERPEIQKRIYEDVHEGLRLKESSLELQEVRPGLSRFIQLEDVLITDVILPDQVHQAIVNKVNQEYLVQEYIARLKVAKREAERKKTEAEGIAEFQNIVAGGISDTYLRWRGIEATIELAKSDNAKVVVIGGGKDGLPLILNTDNKESAQLPDKLTQELNKLESMLQKLPQDNQQPILQSINKTPENEFSKDPATTSIEEQSGAYEQKQ